jgi:superfamily I DNA/RNA helicase
MATWSTYQEAVFADIESGSGHTVVSARAGSGKTTTIMEGLKRVPRGLSVLMVAFNKSIAKELERRAPAGTEVKTLHAYGLRACSRKYGRVRIDDSRLHGLVRVLVENTPETADLRAALAKTVSLAKGCLCRSAREIDALMDDFGIDLGEDGEEADRDEFIAMVQKLLGWCADPYKQAQMKSARQREEHWVLYQSNEAAIDFDDMVWLPVNNELRTFQFDRVFVDETQDLNAAQIELALKACKRGGRILAVGDDRQAIYRFRGADANAMQNVIDRLSAKVLPLSITYRCPKAVVRVAQVIVPDLEWAPNAEEGTVTEASVEEMYKAVREGDFILSRTNAPLIGHCLRLLRDGRRANIQGRDIGAQLASFIKKSKCRSIEALREYTDEWCEREVARLLKKDPPADTAGVEDKAATVIALAEGCTTVEELLANIDRLFSDSDPETKIMLSTTHKAKGLERDNVFMLADTYLRKPRGAEAPNKEEQNLYYVAVTRAKKNLIFVRERKNGGAA